MASVNRKYTFKDFRFGAHGPDLYIRKGFVSFTALSVACRVPGNSALYIPFLHFHWKRGGSWGASLLRVDHCELRS